MASLVKVLILATIVLATILYSWQTNSPLAAQQPPPATMPPITYPTCPTPFPQLPQQQPRPDKAVDTVSEFAPSDFVKTLSTNDSMFEVLVGQSRILTLQRDLLVAKKDVVLSVGDPSIADMTLLNSKQIRVVGLRMGVTNISITTADNPKNPKEPPPTFNFEIRVVPDLHVLHHQLRCMFPEANLKLGQLRDHIVVEGEARSVEEKVRIVATIRSYLDSVKASVQTGAKEKSQPLPETYVIDLIRLPQGAVQDSLRQRIENAQDFAKLEKEFRRKELQAENKKETESLENELQILFPGSTIRVRRVHDVQVLGVNIPSNDIVLEGQVRDSIQMGLILKAVQAHVNTYKLRVAEQLLQILLPNATTPRIAPPFTIDQARMGEKEKLTVAPANTNSTNISFSANSAAGQNPLTAILQKIPEPVIVNLMRLPGPQQVLLKVRIAELNRTGMRQIGSDFLAINTNSGTIIGTQLANSTVNASGALAAATTGAAALTEAASMATAPATTAFGVFEHGAFDVFLAALRQNNLLKILAEPNLVALQGQKANFLAGGQFAYPVPQSAGVGGAAPIITIQFQQFGVLLEFVPFIIDGDLIRLSVDPEVSNIDFTLGTTVAGVSVPGLNQRKAHTVVEMRHGQTLAIAGLMQLTLDGNSNRIPVLGDLPIIGPFFSNTTSQRIEKELIVLVTPYIVEPMRDGQVPRTPGDEVNGANDLEFYLLGRFEGRTGRDHRETVNHDDPAYLLRHFLRMEDQHVSGPHGFGE